MPTQMELAADLNAVLADFIEDDQLSTLDILDALAIEGLMLVGITDSNPASEEFMQAVAAGKAW